MRTMRMALLIATFSNVVLFNAVGQERKTRDELVLEDLDNVLQDGFWIYNDLPKARAEAEKTGKPMLIVLRCIPCEACAQLDSEILERDPLVRKLMSEFVCLRIVQANGLDLSLFQYDYDQSFAAFLMNADKTIYGRYGTRSHQTESVDDVSLEGFAKALQAGLAIHRKYPQNKSRLAGKQPQNKPAFATPELYPRLREKFTAKLNYEDQVARSCIHCHQVGEALREYPRDEGRPIPENVLFPYPHPKSLGLIMDPREMATVKRVEPNSSADQSGFRAGDAIVDVAHQTPISTADIQWVLDHAPAESVVPVRVMRDGQEHKIDWELEKGWRRRADLSWRVTTWSLRRMTTGGMVLNEIADKQSQPAGAADDAMKLVVKSLGQYGPHALAKKSGFQKGDFIVSVDGRTDLKRETDVITYLIESKKIGDTVPFVVVRDGRRHELDLRMQE